jgi:hypothetical protein
LVFICVHPRESASHSDIPAKVTDAWVTCAPSTPFEETHGVC